MRVLHGLVLGLVLCLGLASSVYATAGVSYRGTASAPLVGNNPGDMIYVDIFDTIRNAHDTLAVGDTSNLYGPFTLTQTNGGNQFKGMQIFYAKQTLTTDSFFVYYQLLGSQQITDTSSDWTVWDSCFGGGTGKVGKYLDLTSKAAQGIILKVRNVMSSAPCILDKRVRVIFRTNP